MSGFSGYKYISHCWIYFPGFNPLTCTYRNMTQLYKSDMHLVFPSFIESCFDTLYNSVFKDSLFKKSFNESLMVLIKFCKMEQLVLFQIRVLLDFYLFPFLYFWSIIFVNYILALYHNELKLMVTLI